LKGRWKPAPISIEKVVCVDVGGKGEGETSQARNKPQLRILSTPILSSRGDSSRRGQKGRRITGGGIAVLMVERVPADQG